MNDHSATNNAPGIITEAELTDDAQLIADLADDINRGRAAGWRLRHIITVASFYSADLDASAGDLPPGRKWTAAQNVDAIGQLALELVYWEPDPTTTFVDIRTLALDTLDLVEPEWRDDYVCPQCAAEEAEQWAEEVEMMADAGETEGVGLAGIVGIHPGLENLAAKLGRPTPDPAGIVAEHWGEPEREVRYDPSHPDPAYWRKPDPAWTTPEAMEQAAQIVELAREVMDGAPAIDRLDQIKFLVADALTDLEALTIGGREKREGLA